MSSSPPWAPFLGAEGASWFLFIVSEELTRRGVRHRIDPYDGVVHVEGDYVLGLMNLAQMCGQAPRDRWLSLIAHHLRVALEQRESPTIAAFDQARELVKLRLWERSAIPTATHLVGWDIADDLVAVLTYDLPETLMSVKTEDAARWPVTRDELWRIALKNTREGRLIAPRTITIEGGLSLVLLEDNARYFAASHALFFEEYNVNGAHGAIVAVPRRHTILAHDIVDLRITKAIGAMATLIARMWQEGPGSTSPSLYWWSRPGAGLVRIPWEIRSNGELSISPPPAFATMLTSLAR